MTLPIASRVIGRRAEYAVRARLSAKSVPIECRTMNSAAGIAVGPHDGVFDRDAGEPPCRGRALDRTFVKRLVKRLLRREPTAKELVTSGNRDPGHVVEDLVHADSGPGVRV